MRVPTLLVYCFESQGIAALVDSLLNEVRANVLNSKSLIRARLVVQSHSLLPPKSVHLFGKICVDQRTGTSVVMTKDTIVRRDTCS